MAAKLTDDQRAGLLTKRDWHVAEIKALKQKGPTSQAAHHLRFFEEDLKAIAAKIVSIDRKLGRVT